MLTPDLLRVIHRVMRDARQAGLDELSQARRAVAEVLRLRPDLSVADAMDVVSVAGHACH
jgi:hypothetical protein